MIDDESKSEDVSENEQVRPKHLHQQQQHVSTSLTFYSRQQSANKGKKAKTIAPVAGQCSLDFFIKREGKKSSNSSKPVQADESARKGASAGTAAARDIEQLHLRKKLKTLYEYNAYMEWLKDKQIVIVEA